MEVFKEKKELSKLESSLITLSTLSSTLSDDEFNELIKNIRTSPLPEMKYLIDNEAKLNEFLSKNFKDVKEFRIKTLDDLIKAYKKIRSDKSYKKLIKALKSSPIWKFLKDLDDIQRYIFLKYIVPLFIASGFTDPIVEEITDILISKGIAGILNMKKFTRFIEKMRHLLHIFGTPDGTLVIKALKAMVI